MKALFIGGTGNISTSVSRLCVDRRIELYLLNRGLRKVGIPGTKTIVSDISDPDHLRTALGGHSWDAVVDWIAFTPGNIEQDIALFRGKTKQFVFISSASAYQKPSASPIITESTPLSNPYWEYSRNKIACEDRLLRAHREEHFPATIVRPSHTYDTIIPLALSGGTEYTMVDRIKRGKPIIVHGDGTSLWTLTHAEDFAKGFVGLLGKPESVGQSFHITSDEVLTWNQIHETLAATVQCTANIIHIPTDFLVRCVPELSGGLLGDKSECTMFDNSKIKRFVPEYRATISFSEGIKRTLAWFDADSSRKVVRPETNAMLDRILEAYGHGTR